ncbi:DET1-like protein [Armadillidium vulgare]|nr:DET1-like protein [Armadillidium vulgare]
MKNKNGKNAGSSGESTKQKSSLLPWLKNSRILSQNIATRLFYREIHLFPKRHPYSYRQFYQNVTPNFTISHIQKPPCFLRKFSPDGRYLIAFSADQTSLEIYEYKGPAACGEMLRDCEDEHFLQDEKLRTHVERNIFDAFFFPKYSVVVAANRDQLNRECSLFTDDGRFIIVGSVSLRNITNLDDNYRTNESVTPNPRSPLDDYSLHIVNIDLGVLTDTKTFHYDKIYLSHNQGLYLYKTTLAVLSVQHQTIHIFDITQDGIFIPVREIGRVCYGDDDFFLESTLPREIDARNNSEVSTLDGPHTIYSLKHRLLTFLYRYARRVSEYEGNSKAILEFHRMFNYFSYLRMWKMQLLDDAHLLIKYASEEVVTLRTAEPNGQPSLIVIYNMITTEVISVYENTSSELLDLFEKLSDFFRNARLKCESQFTCSPSNTTWAKLIHERHKSIIVSAKGGGQQEATKRLLGQLPISAQSFSASPYLDLDIFSYDDKWVSVLERPKSCTDHPIRFYGRDSGLLKFCIHAGRSVHPFGLSSSSRRLVAFTFHPFDPFTISVQRTNDEYVVSFHVRHPSFKKTKKLNL